MLDIVNKGVEAVVVPEGIQAYPQPPGLRLSARAAVLPETKLRELVLCHNRIGDDGAAALLAARRAARRGRSPRRRARKARSWHLGRRPPARRCRC